MSRLRSGLLVMPLALIGCLSLTPTDVQARLGATSDSKTAQEEHLLRSGGLATGQPESASPRPPSIRLAQQAAPPPIIAGNPTFAPLMWAGLWTWSDEEYVHTCTAQFITDRVILTAAHCVRDRDSGKYYDADNTKSRFLLQYQNETWSKEYHPLCKITWDQWVVPLDPGEDPRNPETMTEARRQAYRKALSESWQWDYAFVYLDGKSTTGHYNYQVNAKWNGAVSTGYPAKLMGGAVVQRVVGDTFDMSDLSFSMGLAPNERVLWHGSLDYTNGSSGGAWVVNFSGAESPESNIISGLNSFGMSDGSKPGAIFGPFFTDDFTALLNFAANGCKGQ
jgi:hypothetical protein